MAERFTQADVYAALGMDAPAEQPEAADRAGQNGANEPAPTTPAGAEGQATGETDFSDAVEMTGSEGGSSGGTGDPSPTDGGDGGEIAEGSESPRNDNQPMSKAERAKQAAARRERETQAKIEAALQTEREKHKAELRRVFERAGMTDRYNDNKPITTMEEFDAWDRAGQAAGLSRRLQEGKLTAEDFQRAIDNSPAVREAKAAVERLKAQEQESRKQEYLQLVEQELAEIRKLDPGVKDLQDILNRDTGAEFSRLVTENHLTFTQAFRLANADRLARAQTMAAEEGRARQQHGKDHMRTSVSGGGVVTDIPQRTVEMFRQLHPGITMEEIRKEYNRFTPRAKK